MNLRVRAAISMDGIVLGLKDARGTSLTERLARHLEGKRLLLLLDNAEHLVGACADLTEHLLRQCPQLVVLATSRERLGVPGEMTYRVPSLSTPEPGHDTTAQSLAEYESIRLFSERARLHRPHFAVTDHTAHALASICRRLDGIPLAPSSWRRPRYARCRSTRLTNAWSAGSLR